MQAITQLMQGYLHGHYLELYGDTWTAVEAFARAEDDDAQELRAEVEHLLQSTSSERKLRKLLTKDMDCYFQPEADGLTYAAWLRAIADRVDHVRSSSALMAMEEIARTYVPVPGEPMIKGASSFQDRQTAEWTVSTVLGKAASKIQRWLRSSSGGLRLADGFTDPVGQLALAEADGVIEVPDVVVILRRSNALNLGYVIKAAYPALLARTAAPIASAESLAQFLGVYMYQDWKDDYPTMWGAVDDFLASDREFASGLANDVAELLSTVSSERELRDAVLGPYDSWYLAESGGWTYRNWLRAVSQRVERAFLLP